MVALGLISNHYWVRIKGRNSVPANAYPIAIHAKQFEWQVTYPGADGQLGTSDDFTVRNQLHVPVGRPVVVHLSSDGDMQLIADRDRKSTRLNSSHSQISYAVFCLKKKKQANTPRSNV